MKTEMLAIVALAAALAYSSRSSVSGCGPGGCWMLPPDFEKATEMLSDNATSLARGIKSLLHSEHTSIEAAEPGRFGSPSSF